MNLVEILRSLHGPHIEPQQLQVERRTQYEEMFGDAAVAKVEEAARQPSYLSARTAYFERIRDTIIDNNPRYASVWANLGLLAVDAHEEKTSVHSSGHETVLVIDSLMMRFLWMMNKAHVYGHHLEPAEQHKLFFDLFLHFATLRKFGPNGPVWSRPKTPPHDEKEFRLLVFLTEIQERFVIAHEMAHVVSQNCAGHAPDIVAQETSKPLYTKFFDRDARIDEEILADELAVEFVLNTLPGSPEAEQVALSAIFLLIRYRLWLECVLSQSGETYEFRLWLSRNHHFRAKARASFVDGDAMFLVHLLEYLEETLEPAALNAQLAFTHVRKHVQSNANVSRSNADS